MAKKRPTASKLEDVRSDLGDFAFTGPQNVDMTRAAKLRGVLDEYMNSAPVKTQSMAPAEYVKLRGDAREMAQRGILDRELKSIGNQAEGYEAGLDRGIRGQIRSHYRKNLDHMEPAMKEAFEQIIKREGPLMTPLVNLSSRLGGMAAGGAGFASSGPLGLLLSIPGHVAARAVGDAITSKQLKGARQLALAGRKGRKQALKLNKEAARRRIEDMLLAIGRAAQDR
jgi:hypothetical protein